MAKFYFFAGSDDYLVDKAAKQRVSELKTQLNAEVEIINGSVNVVGEVAGSVANFRDTIRTLPMFPGNRVIWFRQLSFLGDDVVGKSETTLESVAHLQEILTAVIPDDTTLVISAAPVDKRRTFIKWCEKSGNYKYVEPVATPEANVAFILNEARKIGASIDSRASELLFERIGANPRLLLEELRKLSLYSDGKIEHKHVFELTPIVAEGDFFEISEAFFSGNVNYIIQVLQHYFRDGNDARPIIASLQNRNRLLIQLRTLSDANLIQVSPYGINGLQAAGEQFEQLYGDTFGAKSNLNIFTQHPYYLTQLAKQGLPPLKKLIQIQHELISVFESITSDTQNQERILQDFAIKCWSHVAP